MASLVHGSRAVRVDSLGSAGRGGHRRDRHAVRVSVQPTDDIDGERGDGAAPRGEQEWRDRSERVPATRGYEGRNRPPRSSVQPFALMHMYTRSRGTRPGSGSLAVRTETSVRT